MKKTILFLICIFFISACSIYLVPVEPVLRKEARGIIVEIGNQDILLDTSEPYISLYIKIVNNTEKKVKLKNSYFYLIDDKNRQYDSVPLESIENQSKEAADITSSDPDSFFVSDKYGNFKLTNKNISEQATLRPVKKHGPTDHRMEEINPHFQVQGNLYFEHANIDNIKSVKFIVDIPKYTRLPLEYKFLVLPSN